MKIVSWNVNGLRSCIDKGFLNFLKCSSPDILCLQETRIQNIPDRREFDGYFQYCNFAQKKGYSGTIVLSRQEALRINVDFLNDTEGRILILEYSEFYLANYYAPHARRDLSRLEHRLSLDKEIHSLLRELSAKKAVILCGDLNVAHTIMDLHNPKANKGNAGFTPEERKGFSELLNLGFVDSFRELHPLKEGAYTWWSYRKGVRERNVGWRIDYILVSESLKKSIAESAIYDEVYGSDHCPIGVQIVPTKKRVL